MSASLDKANTSDNESAERPVREQLRKASIAATASTAAPQSEEERPRGRLQRKRSHDDVEEEEEAPAHKTRHGRKRSRENSPEHDADQPGKRQSGEHDRTKEPAAVDMPEQSTSTTKPTTSTSSTVDPETESVANLPESPKTKRSKVETEQQGTTVDAKSTTEEESKSETAKIPVGSGFANTAAASPFASLASTKSSSEKPQTAATSSFASSGFGALAASSTSAFGALGQNKTLSSFASPSPAGTPASTDKDEKEAPKSAFASKPLGATSGASAFGGGASGFGTLGGSGMGGGFGGFGGGSKLTTFASSGTPGVIGSSKTGIKAFGAPATEEEDKSGDEEDGEAEIKSPKPIEGDQKDERFFEQEIETGEENETTEYNCRAKLYNFVDKKEWKERGLGVVRLNVLNPKEGDESTSPKARLVMRSDGSHRVILNTPIQKGLKFGTVAGERPTGGYVYFMGSIDGQPKLELLQLKIRQQFATELWDHITDLQKLM